MQKTKKNTLSNIAVRPLLTLILLAVAVTAGCPNFATYDDRDPRPPKLELPEFSNAGMIKKVALSLFDNRTQLRFEEVEQSFLLPLSNQVKDNCSDIVLYTPHDSGFPEALIEATFVTEKGGIDNMTIAKIGRVLGLSTVITGRLDNISGFEREKGFWFFKENQHYERIMIQVDMYDVETGAKLISEAYSEELEISDAEFKALATGTVANSPVVMKAFKGLAEDIADDICDFLDDTPWIGFVTRVDNRMVTLSSGADVGLKPGNKLELYNSNKVFSSPKGNRFFLPGTQSGEIEITEVSPNSARGRLLPGATAGPGYSVRFR